MLSLTIAASTTTFIGFYFIKHVPSRLAPTQKRLATDEYEKSYIYRETTRSCIVEYQLYIYITTYDPFHWPSTRRHKVRNAAFLSTTQKHALGYTTNPDKQDVER
jgi:hypothetical protein